MFYLVVEQLHDANRVFGEEVDHGLIVDELDVVELDAFVDIQLLLKLESIGVEELLQVLIRIVDA